MRLFQFLWRIPLGVLMLLSGLVLVTEMSPIYRFSEPEPFSGDRIYNPYSSLDTALCWKRANFHTHTRVKGIFNECPFWPDSVLGAYENLGYDIVTFSNHNAFTAFPSEDKLRIPVYEHGWNVAKLHNLVFNPRRIHFMDCVLPWMPSVQQFKYDRLISDSDFIFMNHPDRTLLMGDESMCKLGGYRLVEAVSGFSKEYTDCHKWDVALSSGHYVPSAISDDLHHPERRERIARRCCFLCCKADGYEDIRDCLLSGNFYSMFLPLESTLPSVRNIGMRKDSVFACFSQAADSVLFIGQKGAVLEKQSGCDTCSYVFRSEDSYVRIAAYFGDGSVIFSNPFARWSGESLSGTPYRDFPHYVRLIPTLLYNLLLLLFSFLLVRGAVSVIFRSACRRVN